jgi:hypothetical protein
MDHDWPSVVAQRYQTWLCLAVQAANVVWVLPRVTGPSCAAQNAFPFVYMLNAGNSMPQPSESGFLGWLLPPEQGAGGRF